MLLFKNSLPSLCLCCTLGFTASLAAQTPSAHLITDQFGYLPEAAKVAVIADPQAGFNSNESYAPGNILELRRSADNSVVYSAAPLPWNGGATDPVSGDKAWWFDFSTVTAPGEYYVFDSAHNTHSAPFNIGTEVYNDVLRAALRTFYYQRCGAAKPTIYAGINWADAAPCHTGASQDTHCRRYGNAVPATELDLSGGWHDAGDYNKYVNFALNPVVNLSLAYLQRPDIFRDDYGIPESGNGVPDLLDELRWELDWLLKMQQPDGSVLCVVGGGAQSPPSADATTRLYGPATTAASFSAAAMLALGSRAFLQAGNPGYANTLKLAAEEAWTWAAAHPGNTFLNSGKLAAGEQEPDAYGLYTSRLCAAVFLYDITGLGTYSNWVENNYLQHHLIQWSWASMYEMPSVDALLYFAALPGVTAAVASQIRNTFANSINTAGDYLGGFNAHWDPYRAWLGTDNYTWGSNQIKSEIGVAFLNMVQYSLNPAQNAKFRDAAAGYLHYLHGVNPLALCYLTNMSNDGAENSAREMYHNWFGDGTAWDNALTSAKGPAPGYLTGGPNRYYSIDGCCPTNCGSAQNNALCATTDLQPPLGQPAMKAYKDWNTSWPQNSWQITEPAIYYQAAYVRLLSGFVQKTSVGVAEVADRAPVFDVLPNPAVQECRLRLRQPAGEAATIRLLDPAGRVLRLWTMTGDEMRIDLSGLPAGLYFVEMHTPTQWGVRRLIVQ